MSQTAHLWLFFVMVAGVVVLPGMDMTFVLASALTGGRRAGFAAVGGIVSGSMCHVAIGATGIAVVLQVAPMLFNAVLWVGALYVMWMGVSMIRSSAAFSAGGGGAALSPVATFRRGAMTNLLNPKAYVFMLAVFPSFLRPEYGPLWLQAVVLGLIIAVTQTGIYGTLALVGDRARPWLESRPAANVLIAGIVGGLLLLVAAFTVLKSWRSA